MKIGIITKVLYFCLVVLAFFLIFLTVYLFGWDLLSEHLRGNDIGNAETAVIWFNRYFPNIPQWFPSWGSGISMIQGTQIGAPLITLLTSRLLSINLLQAMHLWEFLAIYLTALGIFFFVLVKFKSFPTAILAGIFYPLSHASWAWLAEIGTYFQATSFIFYAPALLFLDLFLNELQGETRTRRLIIYFELTAFLVALALLTHVLGGMILIATCLLYALVLAFFSSGRKIKKLVFILAASFLVILVAVLLVGFWYFPYLRYMKVASRNLLGTWSFEQLPYTTLAALFGFAGYESLSQNNSMWYVFFSRPVWILALIGAIFAFLKRDKTTIAASLVSLFVIFYVVAPGIFSFLVKTLLIFWREIFVRGLIPAIILLPVLAAWGCLSLGRGLAEFILRRKQRAINCATPIFTLLIAILALFLFKGGPPNENLQAPCYQGFGRWWGAEVDYCHFWDKLGKIDLTLSSLPAPFESIHGDIPKKLEVSPETRIDISPRHGELVAIWSNLSSAPLVPLYWYAMALNWKYLGYQSGVFYDWGSIEPVESIPELSSWFGTKYILLHKSEDPEMAKKEATDPFYKYTTGDWEEVFYDQGRLLEARRFKNWTGMATWTNRPTILVVGRIDRQGYEQVLRRAVAGALPYEKALIVEGRDDGRLDKYSLEELKKFDGLILYGQVYEDKEKVDKLLSAYVKGGGRLYIESGWQFTNSEWQTHQALEVIPLKKFEWDKGKASLRLNTTTIGGEFNPEKFGPFIFYEDTWNVATAPKEEVKDWGEVILQRNDKPIVVVGNLGQGRVVWSGMNLFGHLNLYQSKEEYNFSQKLFDWLLQGKEGRDLGISFERPNPDKIEFVLNEANNSYSSLLWRENYFPDWRARLAQMADIKIYRAGPNLMLLRLGPNKEGEKIKLEFKLSLISIISRIISFLTFSFLILIIFVPQTLAFFAKKGRRASASLLQSVLEDKEE